ncbi:hypothetical protein [Anaeromyxobacter paludicola]|uniref:Uncharacterized protein n=1 Tax=Anaeromyxobacter paludicola TaxID=2918171 RepID=A0ABM7X9Y1_9BACT|nr:hypothetical protein [Anaeromyxobacter paludicola]BDG08658.1 hypothetical protein AMPC_17710 [Anaeromyxobacter paludicola]
MSSTNVHVRLSSEAWRRYSAEAQTRGIALGTHLRQRLEEQDRLVAELAIHAAAEQSAAAHEQSAPNVPAAVALPPFLEGALAELLLVLRQLAGPQRSAVAQKEVERRGLSSWR